MTPAWVASLLLLLLAAWRRDHYPPLAAIAPAVLQAPAQTATARLPFTQSYADQHYVITPRFEYAIHGLVVSQNDLEGTWFSLIYAFDPLNIRDLCLLYGSSVAAEAYRQVHFQSEGYRCRFHFNGVVPMNAADVTNNHLLPADDGVARTLQRVRVGDQVALRGMLVDYTVGDGGTRRTSTTRLDEGDGACEVIYVESTEILRRATPIWRALFHLGWLGLLATSLTWLYTTFIFPLSQRPSREVIERYSR